MKINKSRLMEIIKEVISEEEKLKESGILYRAGVKKYGKEGMKKIQQAAGKKKSHAEIGKIKDKYEKDKKEGKIAEVNIIKFSGDDMENLHKSGQIEKDGIFYQYEQPVEEGKNKGLWHNIHKKRKRGEKPAKPGDKDYPKTLDIDEAGFSGIDTPPKFSSQEAKKVVDGALKQYATDLRKLQYRVIKDWMTKAKSGVIDFFDLVRGFEGGDMSRAHPYEIDFLKKVLTRDKIVDRFRKYFGGRKGKRR